MSDTSGRLRYSRRPGYSRMDRTPPGFAAGFTEATSKANGGDVWPNAYVLAVSVRATSIGARAISPVHGRTSIPALHSPRSYQVIRAAQSTVGASPKCTFSVSL